MELQSILKMISDENRLRIINIIKDNPLCVGEIQTILATQQSNTSRHLEKLKTNQIIKYYKDGQKVFYYLNKELLNKYEFSEKLIYKDLLKSNRYRVDLDRLVRYENSGLNCDDLRAVDFKFELLNI